MGRPAVETAGNGAEFVAVDRDGNIYGGEPRAEAAAEVRQGQAVTTKDSCENTKARNSENRVSCFRDSVRVLDEFLEV